MSTRMPQDRDNSIRRIAASTVLVVLAIALVLRNALAVLQQVRPSPTP